MFHVLKLEISDTKRSQCRLHVCLARVLQELLSRSEGADRCLFDEAFDTDQVKDTATNTIAAPKKAEQYKCSLIIKVRAMVPPPLEYESEMSPTILRLNGPALCPKRQLSPTVGQIFAPIASHRGYGYSDAAMHQHHFQITARTPLAPRKNAMRCAVVTG